MNLRLKLLCHCLPIVFLVGLGNCFRKSWSTDLHTNMQRRESLQGTPLWNSYHVPIRENAKHKGYGYAYGPEGYNHHNGHRPQESDHFKKEGIVEMVHEIFNVMGPYLFPLPYLIAILPLALPAIPLAFYLDKHGHSLHRPKGNHSETTEHPTELPEIEETTPTSPMTEKPTTMTTSTTNTTRPPPTRPVTRPPANTTNPGGPFNGFPTLGPLPTGFPSHPSLPTGFPSHPSLPTGFPSHPSLPTGFPSHPSLPTGFPSHPSLPTGFPPHPSIPTLLPFPLYLNSLEVDSDFSDDELEDRKRKAKYLFLP